MKASLDYPVKQCKIFELILKHINAAKFLELLLKIN